MTPESLLAGFNCRPLLMDGRRCDFWVRSVMAARPSSPMMTLSVPTAYDLHGSVAVVSVSGTLVSGSTDMLDQLIYGVSGYQNIVGSVRLAAQDERVQSIVLSIDSPGGEAAGMFEAVSEIREAAADKPLVALANSWATSAAYGIGMAAGRFYRTEAAALGSIGVVLAHIDMSAAEERFGVKVTLLHKGERKVDGNPHEPLSDDARAELMGHVETIYSMFVSMVAAARGLDESAVRSQQSRVYQGPQADETGLVDGVRSLAELIQELEGGATMPTEIKTTKEALAAAPAPRPSDTLEEVSREFPLAISEIQARATKAERERVSSIEAAASKRPELAELVSRAKAEGMTLDQFKLAAFEIRPTAASAQLQQMRADSDALDVIPSTGLEAVTSRPEAAAADTPDGWASEFKASAKLQKEYGTVGSYVAYQEANRDGLVRIASKAQDITG